MNAKTADETQRWLAGVLEDPLEPGLDIVDAHHHLWDHVEPPYLLDELLADTASGHRVTQTVFIECGWGWQPDAADPALLAVPETAAVAALAAESERRGGAVIAGIVGHADLRLGAAATGRALDALAEAGQGRFVGIRHATARNRDPGIPNPRTEPVEFLMGDPAWRAGFAELARRGLTYDAWLYHPQIPQLVELARAFPDATIVLDHLGGPLGAKSYRDRADEVLADCRVSLTAAASCPNVSLKLGGIGMPVLGGLWHRGPRPATSTELVDRWGSHIRWCIDTFGPDRCLFESNFPVDAASCSYVVLWNAFKRLSQGYSATERAALFAGTARRVYGLGTPAIG